MREWESREESVSGRVGLSPLAITAERWALRRAETRPRPWESSSGERWVET